MARRGKANPIGGLYRVAAMVPWWAGMIVALVSYLVLHSFATADVAVAKNMSEYGHSAVQAIIKGFAYVGQYLVPIIFIAGAAASATAQAKRRADSFSSYASRISSVAGRESTSPITDQHGADIYPMWKAGQGEKVRPIPVDPTRWSEELLSALEWKRFEMVCAGLFERLGFATRTATKGADGGVDIHLFRPPGDQAVAIVQCKAWTRSSKVGVRLIRELHGVMASKKISDGFLVTTTTFSDDAKEYAEANHIDLLDGSAVLKAIRTLTEKQQASLLQLATAGDYITPTCPSCGIKMKERRAKADGKPFWGCVNYPRCRSIINIAKA